MLQSLTVVHFNFIPINAWQQRASLQFMPGVLERKVYNNDNKTFFSISMFAKPSCDNVMQSFLLRASGSNTLSHEGLANKYTLSSYLIMAFYNDWRKRA